MSAIGLLDECLALAERAANTSPEHRAILLAEIDARLAHDGADTATVRAVRLEVQRLIGAESEAA